MREVVEYMEKQVAKHRRNYEKEEARGVPTKMLRDILFKLYCYEAAVAALKKEGFE